MIFWVIVAGLAAAAAWFLLAPLRASASRSAPGGYNPDMAVYHDQLAEVERDLARGTVTDSEAAQIRLEVQRRMLDADRHGPDTSADAVPQRAQQVLTVAVPLFVVAGAMGLYLTLGAPGREDYPFSLQLAESDALNAARRSQAEAQAMAPPVIVPEVDEDYLVLMDQLRNALKERPDDLEGHVLLAHNEALLGNYADAIAAQERVIALKGAEASPADLVALVDLMVLGAGGIVTPEAEEVLVRTLEADPQNGAARYYAGLLHIQVGRPDRAFEAWRGLLETSPASAPWNAPIRTQIVDLARRAGVNYTPPPMQRGPTAEDLAAASDMSPEDRMQMVMSMVESLSTRLATEGGTAADWAQLIKALGVLGDAEQARAVYDESQEVFASNPEALVLLNRAAAEAGLAGE